MTQRFPELLAPVGGEKQLKAAVAAGADAVYLAGPSFGARSSAQNFDREALADAVKYAHLHGVSVYVTVNTLILDEEMAEAVDFVDYVYEIGADAVILQDIGLTGIIRARHPDLALHASTQMTFHNVEGVRYAKEMGFSRVVLPREMSIEEIREIAAAVDIELEVFVHGALCVSYSGMCLMSSYIGGRSGNRGSCAQPCRKKYELFSTDEARRYYVGDARVLSPKDLSVIEFLDELAGAVHGESADRRDGAAKNGRGGVAKISLKIEGRLKDYDYVFNVVSAYRGLLDGVISSDEARRMLEKSYNRGYTRGFVFSEESTDWRAGVHTGNRGTPIGEVVRVVPAAVWNDANEKNGDERLSEVSVKNGGFNTSACFKSEASICASRGNECARYDSGRVGRYVLILRLVDALCVNDEVQYKFSDGQTVGARAEWIVMDGQRVKSAPAGAVVAMPFGYRLGAGDALVRTYSVEHVAAVDAAMNVQPKRWGVALRTVMRAGEAVRLEAELRWLEASGFARTLRPADGCASPDTTAPPRITPPDTAASPDTAALPLCSASLCAPTPQIATGRGTEPSRIIEQLTRFGGTPFRLDESLSRFDIASGIYVPISELNALRRQIVDIFTKHLEDRYPHRAQNLTQNQSVRRFNSNRETASHRLFSALTTAQNDFPAHFNTRSSREEHIEYLKLPPIISSEQWEFYQQKVSAADSIEIGHISQLAFRDLGGKSLRAAYTVNVFNSSTIAYLHSCGVSEIEISTEIRNSWITGNPYTDPQSSDAVVFSGSASGGTASLCSATEIADTGGGAITLMRMKYCPVGAYFGGGRYCGLCTKFDFALRDEYGAQFPLRLDVKTCTAEVLSPFEQKGKKLIRNNKNKVMREENTE